MGSKKCASCEKTVYTMEMVAVDGIAFHKTCFKCQECKKSLSPGNYASLSGQYFCKPHFKQVWGEEGERDGGG